VWSCVEDGLRSSTVLALLRHGRWSPGHLIQPLGGRMLASTLIP
jgi:hypothetical protein